MGEYTAWAYSGRYHLLHYPRVDVAKLLEPEETGAVGRVIEDEALFRDLSALCSQCSQSTALLTVEA